jgi:malonyl CoA-acyl carrier protein transacylase
MTASTEEFRRRLQTELGLTIGPKDPLLALCLAQQQLLEETAAKHEKLLMDFEAALVRNQANWTDQAKSLANQSLNSTLRAARESTILLVEEAARTHAAAVRTAVQAGVERIEAGLASSRRLTWVSMAASIVVLTASVGVLLMHLLR